MRYYTIEYTYGKNMTTQTTRRRGWGGSTHYYTPGRIVAHTSKAEAEDYADKRIRANHCPGWHMAGYCERVTLAELQHLGYSRKEVSEEVRQSADDAEDDGTLLTRVESGD